jgi:hypothetical protein
MHHIWFGENPKNNASKAHSDLYPTQPAAVNVNLIDLGVLAFSTLQMNLLSCSYFFCRTWVIQQ